MYQGGDFALQARCGGFDFHPLHQEEIGSVADIEMHLALNQDHLGANPSGLMLMIINNLEALRGAGSERTRQAVTLLPLRLSRCESYHLDLIYSVLV